MSSTSLPADCSKQWDILLMLISSEEKKIDRTTENEIDTMNYFYNNEGVKKILSQWLQQMNLTYARKISDSDTALKCNEVSVIWRQRGNDKYHANLIEDSYQCYSKSVVYAKQKDVEYALALANRSAALLRLKRFKECLSDIELSIKSGYKKELLHKLLMRRADCYIELGQQTEAQDAITSAFQHAHSFKMSASQTAEFERHIKILEKKLLAVEDFEQENEVVLPECHLGLNPEFNAASNAIELRYNDTEGRHVVTKEQTSPIKRGDVLFSEEPYAWVTLPTEEPICEMCCQANINIIPCSQCSRSMYCSEACRSQAFVMFHQYECVGGQGNLFPTIGIAHLALRVLLISAYNGFPAPPHRLPKPTTASELFKSFESMCNMQIYKSEQPDFYRMFKLITNFDKMNNTDYIQYALTSTVLMLYLEKFTSFFESLSSKMACTLSDSELRLFAASLMLRSLGQLVCNGHAALSLSGITENGNGRTATVTEVRRATAIYPSSAMMNHSCDPNIINTFHGKRLIVLASREVACGAPVLNCYGPHCAREPAASRRAQLRAQYMFHCACSACVDPGRDRLLLFSAYACQTCKGPVTWQGKVVKCQQCHAFFHSERALAILDQAEELAVQAESAPSEEQRCERMHASFRLKQQVWHRHHSSLRAAADSLARNYADAGEYSKSLELIKQNLQSIEYQFGSFSVEVAHELRKLSEVMLERIINLPRNVNYRDWCLETHKIVKKAAQLKELYYGSWEPQVKRLKKQEAFVAALVADTRSNDTTDCIHHNFHYNLKI